MLNSRDKNHSISPFWKYCNFPQLSRVSVISIWYVIYYYIDYQGDSINDLSSYLIHDRRLILTGLNSLYSSPNVLFDVLNMIHRN